MAAKYKTHTTPVGTLGYPRLVEPDTKFNPEGEFRTNLSLDTPDKLKAFIDKQLDESVKSATESEGKKVKRADPPYKVDDDGIIQFKFKLKHNVTYNGKSWQNKVALFDAKGTPLSNVSIGGGSQAKVAFEVVPYYTATVGAGVSLRLKAAQIIDLVEYNGSATADKFGFEEEDGFDATDVETTESTEEEATPEDDDDDSFL